MFGELERLALAVTTVSWADAKRVVEVANQQLNKLLGAQIVQLYWDKEAQEGALLEPVAFVNNTGHEDPRPFEITSEPNGPLSWVYHKGRPLWLENIEPDMATAQNVIDDTEVPGAYLTMRPTSHARTNAEIIGLFLGTKVSFEEVRKDAWRVTVS